MYQSTTSSPCFEPSDGPILGDETRYLIALRASVCGGLIQMACSTGRSRSAVPTVMSSSGRLRKLVAKCQALFHLICSATTLVAPDDCVNVESSSWGPPKEFPGF